jgi:hypothetical protein
MLIVGLREYPEYESIPNGLALTRHRGISKAVSAATADEVTLCSPQRAGSTAVKVQKRIAKNEIAGRIVLLLRLLTLT